MVDKSTVPGRDAEKGRDAISTHWPSEREPRRFAVVSNPEFLKEGAAVEDCMRRNASSGGRRRTRHFADEVAVHAVHAKSDRLYLMDVRSAEFTKYAANAMLATRISFMNELALLAEKVGVDIEMVRRG
jgi:UDPglucose 6-dehydrogenase